MQQTTSAKTTPPEIANLPQPLTHIKLGLLSRLIVQTFQQPQEGGVGQAEDTLTLTVLDAIGETSSVSVDGGVSPEVGTAEIRAGEAMIEGMRAATTTPR
jgi:hypothetical protein